VVGKIDEATPKQLKVLRANIHEHNARATVVEGRLPIQLDRPDLVLGKRVLIVEDGPTITHGGMSHGAGYLAAQRAGAEIIDPRPYAVGEIAASYEKYAHISDVLPALGYAEAQLADLHSTIERVPCDTVVVATPIDLSRVVGITKPTARVTYSFEESGTAHLPRLLSELFKGTAPGK
jgi:predicted GTPase